MVESTVLGSIPYYSVKDFFWRPNVCSSWLTFKNHTIIIIKLNITSPSNLKALTFQNLCHRTVGTLTCISSHELWLAIWKMLFSMYPENHYVWFVHTLLCSSN